MKTLSRTVIRLAVYTLFIYASQVSAANDKETMAHGKALLEENCVQCHGNEVYTRPDHRMKSLQALSQQVERCKENTNASWFDDDTATVVNYLNTKFYKF